MKHLMLIGFMGTGKTAVGERLHRIANLPWIDTDHVIQIRTGMSISDFFSRFGQKAFRDKETEILKELCRFQQPHIISTGGGLPVREENREMLLSSGCVVCLTANMDVILKRLKECKSRPLIEGGDQVRNLYIQREGCYDFPQIKVDTSFQTIEEVANMVLCYWKKEDEGFYQHTDFRRSLLNS